jgi:glutamyl-tRNA synthetase
MADAAVKEWQDRAAQFSSKDRKALETAFAELDAHLTLRSHIVGYSLSDADTAVWKAIRENHIAQSFVKQGLLMNVSRWFKYIEETNPSLATLPTRPAKAAKNPAEEKEKAKEEGGSFDIGLQDVGDHVVTRFPPEPSYVVPILRFMADTNSLQWLPSYRSRQSCCNQRLLCPREIQGKANFALR